MFAILWFLFIALSLVVSLVWLLDHNGIITIFWLGYEVQTDVLTGILISILLALLIFSFAYFVARILSFRFPVFLKFFFRRNYIKLLEKLVRRHHQAFDVMLELSLALEVGDAKSAEQLQKKYSKLVKNLSLRNFFLGKTYFEKAQFSKASESFEKFGENKYAKVLFLKSKFYQSLSEGDDIKAIAYGKQIMSFKYDSFDVAKILFSLYGKHGLDHDLKALTDRYGKERFIYEDGLWRKKRPSIFKSISKFFRRG